MTSFRQRYAQLSEQLASNSGRHDASEIDPAFLHFTAHVRQLLPSDNTDVCVSDLDGGASEEDVPDDFGFGQRGFLSFFAHEALP